MPWFVNIVLAYIDVLTNIVQFLPLYHAKKGREITSHISMKTDIRNKKLLERPTFMCSKITDTCFLTGRKNYFAGENNSPPPPLD